MTFRPSGQADDRLLDRVPACRGIRRARGPVLDVGSGLGEHAAHCHAQDADYTSLDLVLRRPKRAGSAARAAFLLADGQPLPVGTACVDVIFRVEALERPADQEAAAGELRRRYDPAALGGQVP